MKHIKFNLQFYVPILFSLIVTACVSATPEEDESAARRAAETNTELGRQYMSRGDYEIALDKLKRAIAHDKTYAPAHTVLAYLYEYVGDDEMAGREYREAVKYDPDDGSTNNNYGAFLCSTGDWKESEKYFEKALADPFYDTPALALSNAGLCAFNSGDLDKAEVYLRQSLEYDPNLPASLLAMGRISYEREQFLNARAFLQRYEIASAHTEESLLQAYRIEKALGDEVAASDYRRQLIQEFPQSNAAKQLTREPTQ